MIGVGWVRGYILAFYVYLFLRERERERASMSTGGGDRGGQRIQSGPHCDSREPDAGLKLMVCETAT